MASQQIVELTDATHGQPCAIDASTIRAVRPSLDTDPPESVTIVQTACGMEGKSVRNTYVTEGPHDVIVAWKAASADDQPDINADLLSAALAALDYDEALEACGNDPDKMASHCTAQGETLDVLYERWTSLCRKATNHVADAIENGGAV